MLKYVVLKPNTVIKMYIFIFWQIYMYLRYFKKFGNIATLQPLKSSIFSFGTPFFRSKRELINISIIKDVSLKFWQHFGKICFSVSKT